MEPATSRGSGSLLRALEPADSRRDIREVYRALTAPSSTGANREGNIMQELMKSIGDLRSKTQSWARGRLWAQVLVGLGLGILVGGLLGPELDLVDRETARVVGKWLAVPGRVFLALISMVLVPLVFVSIIKGISESESGAQLRTIGLRLVVFVVITTTIACMIGITLAGILTPGRYVDMPQESAGEAAVQGTILPPDGELEDREDVLSRLPDALVGLIPTNPQEVFLNRNMLAIVVLAILFGIAATLAARSKVEVLLGFLEGLLEISMTIVGWAMFLAPWAVFGLMAELIADVGLSTLVGLAMYVATVILGLLIMLIIYLVIIAVLRRRNPFRFLSRIGEVMLMAFSTSSTAAVMPLSIDTSVKRLGVDNAVANLVIPLGATINMAGTALYQSVAIIFLAQLAGMELPLAVQIGIVSAVVASSIGAPGTPGVGVVIMANIAAGVGIPTAGLVLVLGVDRILDMMRTAVNVTGDLTAATLLGAPGGEVEDSPGEAEASAA